MVLAQARMYDLVESIKKDPNILCLLGLGSMSETNRLDNFSDMDFFLIVKEGTKETYLSDLSWLAVKTIVFSFKNSDDGHKVMFEDGVFAEFAIFTELEIQQARFSKGLVYYKKDGFNEDLIRPRFEPKKRIINVDYHVNEALSNILIGLKRAKRGELSSATTFIQSYAYELVLGLFTKVFKESVVQIDPFVLERRIENRFIESNDWIANMRQGYLRNKESAQTILKFLMKYFNPNHAMVDEIEKLIKSL